MATTQIAVLDPVKAASGAFVIDLPASGENPECICDAPRARGHHRTGFAADRPWPVADGRAIQPPGSLCSIRQATTRSYDARCVVVTSSHRPVPNQVTNSAHHE